MYLVHYQAGIERRAGFCIEGSVFDLQTGVDLWEDGESLAGNKSSDELPGSIDALLRKGLHRFEQLEAIYQYLSEYSSRDAGAMAGEWIYPSDQVRWLPPILRPGKIICVGLNYPAIPGNEAGERPEYPVLFHKVSTALTGHRTPIVMPAISREVEYEGELAVVIGRRAKNVREEESLEYVAGYTIANDIGARDLQRRSSQWTSGKMFDTFCPLGPMLATKIEAPEPNRLRLETMLNGTLVQSASTAEMIFHVPHLVSYISSLTTLEPGDLILTGSPKRVGAKPDPRTLLQPGDEITVIIENLGSLCNPVVREEV